MIPDGIDNFLDKELEKHNNILFDDMESGSKEKWEHWLMKEKSFADMISI